MADGYKSRMRQDPQRSANAIHLLLLFNVWSFTLKIQPVHIDDGEVVQDGARELDAVCRPGVHSIEYHMGAEQVTWHEQGLVATAMPQLSVWLGNKAKDSMDWRSAVCGNDSATWNTFRE